MTSRSWRRAAAAVLTTVLATVLSVVPSVLALPAGAADGIVPAGGRTCTESLVPVRIAGPDANLTAYQIFARYCAPNDRPAPTVQVLVHGLTYDHRYWDIPDPDGSRRYSWEAAAARSGYATLAIDRLGSGRSSHPPSAQVDLPANVAAVRAVISELRAGRIAAPWGTPVRRVALVGHSYGSVVSWYAASANPEVDALVLTGATRRIREVQARLVAAGPLYPAASDPAFAASGLDAGYLVHRPGTRYENFFAPDTNVDSRVLAWDEAHKGTAAIGELNTAPAASPLDIRVPVFLLIGGADAIFCAARPGEFGSPCRTPRELVESERPLLGPSVPSVDAHVVRGAGHALNALRSSQESFRAAHRWLHRTVAP